MPPATPSPAPSVGAASVGAAGLALIKHFEGLRLTAYRCPAGVLTIGYGHTGPDVTEGQCITTEHAQQLLAQDLIPVESVIHRLVQYPIDQNQYDALVSFTFNVGAGALASSTLLKRLNGGEVTAVPSELRRWNRAAGQVMLGLVARRNAEAALWSGSALMAMPQHVDAPTEGDGP